jgi:ketosteroid isomerase-like protein
MWRFILILAAGIAAVAVSPRKSEEDRNTRAEREVRELEAQLDRAVVEGDREFFERVLAPDFTHTCHTGKFKTRAEWMAENKFANSKEEPKPGKTSYVVFDVDDLAVRTYGETAVVTGRSTSKGRNAKGEPIRGQYRFLRVWVQRQGKGCMRPRDPQAGRTISRKIEP